MVAVLVVLVTNVYWGSQKVRKVVCIAIHLILTTTK